MTIQGVRMASVQTITPSRDCVSIILRYLPPEDLCHAIKVCKVWHAVIIETHHLHGAFILAEARKILGKGIKLLPRNHNQKYYISIALKKIFSVQLRCDIPGAKQTVSCFPNDSADKPHLMTAIATQEARLGRLYDARETAKTIPLPLCKVQVYCELAKENFEYLDEVEKLLPNISGEFDRNQALVEKAKVEVHHKKFAEAKKTAGELSESGQYYRFPEIIKEVAKHSLVEAKKWAAEFESVTSRLLVEYEIAKIEGDFTNICRWGLECAEKYNEDKIKFLIEIAERDPNHSFKAAKKAVREASASQIYLSLSSNDRYSDIALAEAQYDPQEALKTAYQILDPEKSHRTIFVIHLAARDFASARTTAEELSDPVEKTSAFCDIAAEEPGHNLSASKVSIHTITNLFEKAVALCQIAHVALGEL